MGLFKKKEVKKEVAKLEIPKLPDIPALPEIPNISANDEMPDETIYHLPSFPNSFLGDRFSQYNIKEAVTGEKEEEEQADDFAEEMQMMQKPLVKTESKTIQPARAFEKPKETEPLFIRIDKFEEGSRNFENVKKQISDIEKMFDSLKKVKEDEEKEMSVFEDELRQIKEKIENIDNNIFSRVQ
jgi:hypothetical protein